MNFAETFRQEATDLLAQLEVGLLELESHPEDSEVISLVFRILHTIKGSGAMFGFEALASFTHDVESVYDLIRDGKMQVTPRLISLTLMACDHIGSLLGGAVGDEVDTVGEKIKSELRDIQNGGEVHSLHVETDVEPPSQERTYHIQFNPSENTFLRGVSLVKVFREMFSLGQVSSTCHTDLLPDLADFAVDRCYLYWDMSVTTDKGEDAVRDVFLFVEEGFVLKQEPAELEVAADEDIGQVAGEQEVLEELPSETGAADAEQVSSRAPGQQNPVPVSRAAAKPEASSLRVSADKLDDLVNVVGEIVTMQARLTQLASACADPEVAFVAEELERLTDKLRDNTMSIRMLPIGATFGNYKRLVRDLSRQLEKQVELITEGADTQLDKTVIDRINDPLVHLIRNCVDHGVESPDKRAASGKQRMGKILLSAAHSGAHVIIQIKDDGAGLDKEAIKRKAVSQGLVRPDQELTEQETFSLILKPGFSTAATLSGISGRGVGMDVVKQNVESLSGTLEINSKKGEGTCFTLKLPLTLAIIDGLLVKIADHFFVMPLANILECFELSLEQIRSNHGRRFVEVRGEMVPYVDIREYFNLDGPKPPISHVMIADTREGKFGFMVDNVIGDHKTVIKRLGALCKDVESLSGATILGDGTVALILDLSKLAQGAVMEQAHRQMALV